jgi:hypothetical protein
LNCKFFLELHAWRRIENITLLGKTFLPRCRLVIAVFLNFSFSDFSFETVLLLQQLICDMFSKTKYSKSGFFNFFNMLIIFLNETMKMNRLIWLRCNWNKNHLFIMLNLFLKIFRFRRWVHRILLMFNYVGSLVIISIIFIIFISNAIFSNVVWLTNVSINKPKSNILFEKSLFY